MPSTNTSKIYLCTGSDLKVKSVARLVKLLESSNKTKYELIPKKLDYDTIEQPINSGTFTECDKRIKCMEAYLNDSKIELGNDDMIIALESGTFFDDTQKLENNPNIHDVCIMMVRCGTKSEYTFNQYSSFGIQIDNDLFNMYMEGVHVHSVDIPDAPPEWDGFDMDILGRNDGTFGKFLQKSFSVQHNNWMKDPRFGNCDRSDQINDCCNKFLIDFCTDTVPDFPRKGVLFKDITSIMVNQTLLSEMYKLLERFILDNYDIEKLDYFAGLDARGFYFAPVLAKTFGKGFIPVRKAKKVPRTNDDQIVTQSYGTEYSEDEFGLTVRSEFKGKNVLILDDLLATGGSLIGASSVLKQSSLNVVGAVTIYDVLDLRYDAEEKLEKNGIKCKVLINNNHNNVSGLNDFAKLHYKIPDIVLKRIGGLPKSINKDNEDTKDNEDLNSSQLSDTSEHADKQFDDSVRKFTMTSDEWLDGMDSNNMSDIKVIYTEKDKELATKLLNVMNREFGVKLDDSSFEPNISSGLFSNGEIRMDINTNVRNKHVVVVSQVRTNNINTDLMELFMIMDALQRANSEKITVVLPYYPYSRSDKKDSPRCAIGAAVIANIFEKLGVDNLISIDLHAGQLQGLIRKGFHNLYIKNYMCEFIYRNYLRFEDKNTWNDKFILISPDAGAAKAVKSYSKSLGINNIILDKQRDYSKPSTVMKSRIIGDVNDFKGKTGLIIDDIGDTMGTMCSASKELVDNGMKDVIVFLTHGILSGPAIDRINNTPYIKEVIVTDTLPQELNIQSSPKIRVLSTAELIARTIDGILTGRSISRLFK
jgi:ribose-phosphate pyrophosphokinase